MAAITVSVSSALSPLRPKAPFLRRTAITVPVLHVTNRPSVRFASFSDAVEAEENWEQRLEKLPEKKKPLYSHSLPCIEAWLRKLGFRQSRDDRAVWVAEMAEWHAELSLDVTDLYIRYLKSGPGNLEKDVERRFSYALSREDIENAILGGP
ncbi:hypothetical protein LUZ60_000560 [Juncus effusus]|nr:hypothetical protein LUZ60_000560 [Juncus effusus]